MSTILALIPAVPFAGALVNGLFGSRMGKRAPGVIGSATVGVSFALSVAVFAHLLGLPEGAREIVSKPWTWMSVGSFNVDLGFAADQLSAVMILVVSGVAFLIHVYSIGYMSGDPGYHRFFSYMNLFAGSMLTLVMADNFLLLYLGWEAVGLCSYLLIGFWYERPAAAAAGMKAFVVNRVGDFGFALGVMLIFVTFGTLDFNSVFGAAPVLLKEGGTTVTLITLLLFAGAIGKSAQFPLHVWLPDAMEGPTPVSALIHAATMVTAGVYLVARASALFVLAPISLTVVAIVGVFTAVFAATIALTQNDIKRVLAYSTISQLGYMFLACGVGAFAAGIFHLMTHAFFKALLFLGAGAVMHSIANEQDLRAMGGLRSKLPVTHWTMLAATLAIVGIPGFSGFFSKDAILLGAFGGGWLFWVVGVLTAGLTAFYMFRLMSLTFYGKSRVKPDVHVHRPAFVMTVPLVALAVFSLIGGYIGLPKVFGGGEWFSRWLDPVLGSRLPILEHGAAHHPSAALEYGLMAVAIVVVFAGIGLAVWMYTKRVGTAERFGRALGGLPYRISLNKYWIDEVYDTLIVRPFVWTSRTVYHAFDLGVIDALVNGAGRLVAINGAWLRKLQTGYARSYVFMLTFGVAALLAYVVLR
jgi:NADH-quinone oxidoreductase subunit L